ncbi:hypothetical protein [Fibrobacter sp. UBA4309]|uniref:hypothetical protein n=1 Tax=Fibrobacter sp. UBA4309 TaxID=1946537 RepID=UPI0025B83E3B|nr:hypothetical protein [Fibrobacter sp. UBA4309]
MKRVFIFLCLVLSSCGCWELSDEHCQEFWEDEHERDSRKCTDFAAVERCKAEQQEILATQQPGKPLNIDSLCNANTEKIKCIDNEKYGF